VSTFRLEPEHFHQRPPEAEAPPDAYISRLARSTLLSKTDSHFRLSGALSVRTGPPEGKPVRPRNLSNLFASRSAVNPVRSQDFHLFSTFRGVSIRTGSHIVQLIAGELFTARSKTLFRTESPEIGACRSGRRLNK